jgi:hypothetical protein
MTKVMLNRILSYYIDNIYKVYTVQYICEVFLQPLPDEDMLCLPFIDFNYKKRRNQI